MQCDGFKPGCTNDVAYLVQGYRFCLPCAREFAGYTPDVLDEAQGYLDRLANFPGQNDSLDHLRFVLAAATSLRAQLPAARERAERAEGIIADMVRQHCYTTVEGEYSDGAISVNNSAINLLVYLGIMERVTGDRFRFARAALEAGE